MDEKVYERINGVFHPLGKRACPILKNDKRGRLRLVGTGVPVIDMRVGMLLTATHVAEEFRNEPVVIGGARGMMRFPLMASGYSPYSEKGSIDVDVCALALPAEAVKEMRGFYTFTTAEEIGEVDEQNKLTFYGFVGCPASKNRWRPTTERWVKPYIYASNALGNIDDVTTPGRTHFVHFAVKVPSKAVWRGQQRLTPPKPNGISGCGVWKVRFDRQSGKESKPELVGIGIEYISRSNLMVATKIGAAAGAVSTLHKDIEAIKPGGTGMKLWFSDGLGGEQHR